MVVAGQRWLDLGCGSGVFTRVLLDRGACVAALDGSRAMLDAAKVALEGPAVQVDWIHGDVRDLSRFEDGHFDGIVCFSVIEYLPDASRLIGEVSRVLRNDGFFIFSVPPNFSLSRGLQKLVRKFLGLFGVNVFEYLSVSILEISRTGVESLVRNFGMSVMDVRGFDSCVPAWMRLVISRPALMIYVARKDQNATAG
ncbi:class I SAM-dependent methyltransferase [Thermomonas sp. S9]|uniref:class I SAM-dependent methyltransferase n=1 Tax=Thermomonas sp. S9 TaxID=2885203 RepID=UPI00216B2188|nr:class I SAM-dependent methyltransferase [Thermomonas sp. S9]MCR6496049.1 class I SAM-dependent methyltransferase [Thermomonas sp. S9]